jgi:hypothetical protein
MHDFLKLFYMRMLEDVSLAVKQRLWVSAQWSSSILIRCPAVVKCITSRKVDWILRADSMASSVSGSDSDVCLLREHLKEHAYAVPPTTMEDLLA